MSVPKPPASLRTESGMEAVKWKSRVRGCWGLLFLVSCTLSSGILAHGARIPASAAGLSAFAPSARRQTYPLGPGAVRKRNVVLEHAALYRNASALAQLRYNLPLPSPSPATPNVSSSSSLNYHDLGGFTYNASEMNTNTSNSGGLVRTTLPLQPQPPVPVPSPQAASDRIGQALMDPANFYLTDNTIQCRSEECFEAGMHTINDFNHNPNLPTSSSNSVPPSQPPPPPPTPPMRQQIADAILYTDYRKSRGREAVMHPRNIQPITVEKRRYESAEYWRSNALEALHNKLLQRPIEAIAKNIIFFLGDGMSVPTVTAARILKGQQVDHMPFGEEAELHMDTFPYTGISKTFCSDAQVADSACTATAYLCGVKANSGTIGLTPAAQKNNCSAQHDPANRLSSILAWAQAAGKATGVITTARITHATPAGTYANIANRNWENNQEIKRDGYNPDECDDIAEQLVLKDPGRNINVIMGGGRLQFLPRTKVDPENGRRGLRTDGKDLIESWKEGKYQSRYAYVEGAVQLRQLDTSNVDYLLGLFAPSHMEYYHEQEKHDDPSLTEMSEVAINILSRNPNGYFLFIEGARTDHAHHSNQGLRAMWETVEMDRAVQKADEMTHDEETLILVTADHSHTFSIAGYPPRGNPISGIAEIALDNLPYTTMTYANGPAFKTYVNNRRYNISNDPLDDVKYKQIPNIPRKSETHGGDDVTVMAKGPFAHLFTGVQQQSYIPHALGYAGCIGPGPKYCDHVFY